LPDANVHILQNGDVLHVHNGKAQVRGSVPSGIVLVDGLALGEMKGSVLKERRELAEDGVLIVSVVLDGEGKLAGEVRIESRGFIHTSDATALYEEMHRGVLKVIDNIGDKAPRDPEQLEARIRGKVREIVRRTTRATPNVIPMITFLRPGEGKVMPPARSQAKKEGVDL